MPIYISIFSPDEEQSCCGLCLFQLLTWILHGFFVPPWVCSFIEKRFCRPNNKNTCGPVKKLRRALLFQACKGAKNSTFFVCQLVFSLQLLYTFIHLYILKHIYVSFFTQLLASSIFLFLFSFFTWSKTMFLKFSSFWLFIFVVLLSFIACIKSTQRIKRAVNCR